MKEQSQLSQSKVCEETRNMKEGKKDWKRVKELWTINRSAYQDSNPVEPLHVASPSPGVLLQQYADPARLVPTAHGAHCARLTTPVAAEAVPAGQLLQLVALLTSEYVPAGQSSDAVPSVYEPSWTIWQEPSDKSGYSLA